MNIPEFGVQEGYSKWAQTYDGEENPLIRLEEQAVAFAVLSRAAGTHAELEADLDSLTMSAKVWLDAL